MTEGVELVPVEDLTEAEKIKNLDMQHERLQQDNQQREQALGRKGLGIPPVPSVRLYLDALVDFLMPRGTLERAEWHVFYQERVSEVLAQAEREANGIVLQAGVPQAKLHVVQKRGN